VEKERLFDSERFKVMLAAILVEIGLFFADAYMVDVDTQVLQTIAVAIAGLVATFIWGRTKRNTALPDELDRSIFSELDLVGD